MTLNVSWKTDASQYKQPSLAAGSMGLYESEKYLCTKCYIRSGVYIINTGQAVQWHHSTVQTNLFSGDPEVVEVSELPWIGLI